MSDTNRSHEVNDIQPSSLKHLVGNRHVIDQVAVALDACQQDNKTMASALLVGPPGVGKSILAAVLAQELVVDFHSVLGQSIASNADLNALLLVAKDKDVVFIDEADELRTEFQTALYLAIDQRKIVLQTGVSRRCPQAIPIADFCLLLASNHEHSLAAPLRDRMKLLLRFGFYSEPELAQILLHRSKALSWEIYEDLFPQIAKRARGVPRQALRLLSASWRVCRSQGEDTITAAHFTRACQLEQIDDLGLGPTEQKYLSILNDGAVRLNILASVLGLPAKTIAEVIEPFLIRLGLVTKDEQSRRNLTALGREHLANLRTTVV
jgi:Holliday junction DNA helicase RuvB